MSYKDAGVDIDAGNALIEKIKGAAKRTRRLALEIKLHQVIRWNAMMMVTRANNANDGMATYLETFLKNGKSVSTISSVAKMARAKAITCIGKVMLHLAFTPEPGSKGD